MPATEYEVLVGEPLGQDCVVVKGNDNSDDNDTETRTPRVKKKTEKEKMADSDAVGSTELQRRFV